MASAFLIQKSKRGESAPPIHSDFGSNSWDTISAASDIIERNEWDENGVLSAFGWNLGDSKDITVGTLTLGLRILGYNHDHKVGGGKAGISLELAPVCLGPSGIHTSNSNSVGWNNSNMRITILPSYLTQLPDDLQAVIKNVLKPTATSGSNTTIIQSQDILWLLSVIELTGQTAVNNATSSAGEGTQYLYYVTNNTQAQRIKQRPLGTDSVYWLRSPSAGGSTQFCGVSSIGFLGGYNAGLSYAISFGLCV